MSRTIVITGGTSGIGLALARHYAALGEQVVAVGSSEEGGRRLRAEVPRARFVRCDLSSLRETRDLVERLSADHPVIDALVLAAFRYNPRRVTTAEGFEHTFALYVLNRRLMAEGLRGPLEKAPSPVIVNLCGAGRGGRINWDDLQLENGYRAVAATMQGARASVLLGAAYGSERVKYVLYNPVFVATGLHEPFRQPLRGVVRAASALFGQPVARAVPPITALIDRPPAEPVSVWRKGKRIEPAVDRDEAQRFASTVLAMSAL
ncbi:NAD(P)-dependent dehydrogenase (short-subunit alcohol dehydrogenase family) [Nonomuraea thailandensis]|uniref:NAD(P)-dependent dehydrogenase (Short-subunit alcohol dehydrogenase family) n=1 Tax=Nonomuraea thailandensis TaxID=1188745 RepID=A0A9X2GV78_9ACTN|nr:SDR family NAD(P)-dependent oxidoreductase [Nonomuraea thailandensis]MCP2362356.1 NAD(P)-dependent dehydrogenase (short-subunit alcohol dehydrogenase family) [Nonomuraea thailandensis]